MASRHASTGAEQKLVTYGMPSRKRHNSNPARAPRLSPGSSRTSRPSEPPEKIQPASTATQSKRNTSKTEQGRTNANSFERDTSRSYQPQEELRKRNHLMAFGTDAGLEMVKPLRDFRTPNPSASQPLIGGSQEGVSNCSISTLARRPAIPYSMEPTQEELNSFDPNSEVVSKGHVGSPRREICSQSPTRLRRPRLIDALTAQRADSPESDVNDYRDPAAQSPNMRPSSPQQEQSPAVKGDARSRTIDGRGLTFKRKKIKFTYSQARSISNSTHNAGASDIDDYAIETNPPLPVARGLSNPPSSPSSSGDVEDSTNPRLAIQSVHELRRAGANNRFSDEMDDLLYRIGSPTPSPSTMRRNGLCELAHMLQREDFTNQFRDHASRDSIAKGIRGENDIISGFALAAVLVIFLSSGSAPHMLRQLAEDGIGPWAGRLLAVQDDISVIAAQKSNNVPRATRSSLASVKNILAKMPIWHGYNILCLSPRTIALQLLVILIRCSDTQHVQNLVADLAVDVGKLADYYAKNGSSDDVEFALIVSILEAQSSLGAVFDESRGKMQQEASSVGIFLQWTLQRWPGKQCELDASLLKLAINTTNNKFGAEAFNDNSLLSSLVGCICTGFAFVQGAMGASRFESGIYDELLLVLGIMINVLEHCPAARITAGEGPLQDLVGLWRENQLLMHEADSVEKSKLSVALGYIAVLLGYLRLAQEGWAKRQQQIGWPSIQSLVKAIQEFIKIYQSIDSRVYELEGLVSELLNY